MFYIKGHLATLKGWDVIGYEESTNTAGALGKAYQIFLL